MTTVDSDTSLFDLVGRLEISLGRSAAALERVAARKPPAQPQPVFYRIAQAGIVPASGPLWLRLGGPDQGHIWHVRSIVIGGATPTTSIAGRGDVFVSATDLRLQSSIANIGLADWRDQANTLPLVSFYGNGELPLRLNEELYVAISNGTPSQAVTVAAQIEDVEEGEITLTWGL